MIYLCPQPNPFRYRLWLQDLKGQLEPSMADFNFQIFDGARVDAGEIAAAAMAMPMMSDVRIVEVTGLLDRLRSDTKQQTREERALLLEALPDLPAETLLILAEPSAQRSKDWRGRFGKLNKRERELVTGLSQSGQLETVELPTPRNRELDRWIEKRCADKSLRCDRRALAALGARAGHDLLLLETELDKLAAFADGDLLTVEDVESLVTDYREEPIWQLANAVFSQQPREAIASLAQLEAQGFTPYQILATLGSQLRLIAAVKGDNAPDDVIASSLQAHPYPVSLARRRARHYTESQILYLYDLMQEADYAMKSQPHADQILEALIGRLVTPALWERS